MNDHHDRTEADNSRMRYWPVLLAGIIYIILLGLFTYLFNNPF